MDQKYCIIINRESIVLAFATDDDHGYGRVNAFSTVVLAHALKELAEAALDQVVSNQMDTRG